jgi:hypothetical protein
MRAWSLGISAALLALLALAAGPSWSEETQGQQKWPKSVGHETHVKVTYYFLPG